MTIRERDQEQQVAQWMEIVQECRSSGQTVTEWCNERDISTKTYYRWEKRVLQRMDHEIKRVERISSEKKVTEFVELTVKKEEPQAREFPQTVPAEKQPAVIAVVKGRKIEVEIYAGVELPVVETICQVVCYAE